MMYRERISVVVGGALVAALVGAAAVLFYSGGDYAVHLPNGYELVRTNAATITVWSPRGINRRCVIPPKIVLVGRNGDLIYGFVEKDPASDPVFDTAEGYFLLDTKDGTVSLRLTERELIADLRKRGVPAELSLRRPSRTLKWRE